MKKEITKGAEITNTIDAKTKYLILIPANQSAIIPLKAIKIDVPRSGCDITRKIGMINITKGIARVVKLFTLCNCTL